MARGLNEAPIVCAEAMPGGRYPTARAGDPDRIVACFAADAEMVTAHDVYRGKEAIAGDWRWMCAGRNEAEFRATGAGRLVCGDTVVREVIESGRTAGVRYDVPVMGSYAFDETGHVRRWAAHSDQWALWKQVAAQSHGVQGLLLRSFVGMLDKASSRGRPTRQQHRRHSQYANAHPLTSARPAAIGPVNGMPYSSR